MSRDGSRVDTNLSTCLTGYMAAIHGLGVGLSASRYWYTSSCDRKRNKTARFAQLQATDTAGTLKFPS